MARGQTSQGHWWSGPPAWAWVVMVVAAGVIAVGLPLTAGRGDLSAQRVAEIEARSAAREAARTAEETAAPAPVIVAFLGDSYTEDGTYVQRVAAKTGWTPTNLGQGGTGYVSAGADPDAGPFAERVPDVVAARPRVLVVQGSPNDTGAANQPQRIQAAAADLYEQLQTELPLTRIVVLGPTLVLDRDPEDVTAVRDALAAAAAAAGLPFVDPIALDWLPATAQYQDDGLHPTPAGYASYADELVAEVRALVEPLD